MIGSSAWWQKRLSGTMAGAFSPSSAVADLGLSVALFAPGWTWEHAEPGTTIDPPPPTSAWGQASEDRTEPGRRLWEEFAELDARFWTGGRSSSTEMILSSSSAAETHSFKRALNAYFPARAPPLLNNASPMDTSAPAPHVFYHTTFARGSGTAWYVSGRQVARWKAEEEPATVSSISELDFSPVVDDDNDDKKRKAKEALEDRARARVLVGWTDAGVSLPKPDATWPRPSCVWVSTSEQKLGSTEVTTVAATALGVTSVGLHGSASSAALVDAEFSEDPDHVWMGNCSLRLRLPSRSDEKPVHSLFVPVSWVPFPPTSQEGGVEQSIQATAYVHGLHTVQGRMRLGMRFVDGSILQGRNEAEPQLPNSSWTQVSTTFSITGDRIRKSTPHASMQAQAILGFILDSTTADDQAAKDDRLSEIYIGELCLSTATASARDQDQRTPSSTSHSLQVERGQDDLLLLTWPDFAPAAHFYEVFAQSPSHGGGDGERSWLGTATRERSRTEFVIPLPAVRSIVGTSVGEGEGVRFVVRPFGSCWGDACGIGLLPG
ncbi:unnamed protein product [Tilletia caries]|nr:hypothetical protein CF335_g8217 [Tilletia laevis]KAE8202739.1 hypothetical protein CF328_g2048 [Tilletia controversa]KAE8261126.1 hypothetical protein A4X03_0g3521 [Tilletia caries]CAD6889210.1 unnamed protein product [Tilletia caries]CAD6938129.1 unnamed protein product [Tilletia controversa]